MGKRTKFQLVEMRILIKLANMNRCHRRFPLVLVARRLQPKTRVYSIMAAEVLSLTGMATITLLMMPMLIESKNRIYLQLAMALHLATMIYAQSGRIATIRARNLFVLVAKLIVPLLGVTSKLAPMSVMSTEALNCATVTAAATDAGYCAAARVVYSNWTRPSLGQLPLTSGNGRVA